jgi:hypothetical protein
VATQNSPLQTEYSFTLPRGYVDMQGKLQREGTMRLATALDEIAPMRDPKVRDNQAYLTIAILSRVVTKLGDMVEVNATTIERLFTADLIYLQDFYRRINNNGTAEVTVTCPNCSNTFKVEPNVAHVEPGGA